MSVICVEHRIASYWAGKNCHGNSITVSIGRCKQPLQWTFFCHDFERNVHGLESHVCWVKQDARALRGIRRG